MIQPLFAFADLGFFFLRLFLGVLLFEEGWKGINLLIREKRRGFIPWILYGLPSLLGLLLIIGAVTQIAALFSIVFLFIAGAVRESLFSSRRVFGLFVIALLVLTFTGGGILSVDQLFGLIIY